MEQGKFGGARKVWWAAKLWSQTLVKGLCVSPSWAHSIQTYPHCIFLLFMFPSKMKPSFCIHPCLYRFSSVLGKQETKIGIFFQCNKYYICSWFIVFWFRLIKQGTHMIMLEFISLNLSHNSTKSQIALSNTLVNHRLFLKRHSWLSSYIASSHKLWLRKHNYAQSKQTISWFTTR